MIDVNQLDTVNIRLINGLATATAGVGVGANLDADQAAFAGGYAPGDMALRADLGGLNGIQAHFTRDLQVFDSLGRAHNITIAFLKNPAANTWDVEFYGNPAEVETGDHPNGLLGTGQVPFNGHGTLGASSITPAC